MFLDFTQKHNPALIEAAFDLHRNKSLEPDTYLLDIDAIAENAVKLQKIADKHDITLYFMSKQIGRNPVAVKTVIENGFYATTAVDFYEARTLHKAGIRVANIGHLVQIPDSCIPEVLAIKPDIITIFSVEKAKKIAEEAEKEPRFSGGKKIDLMLRVYDEGDIIYPAQDAGFCLKDLPAVAAEIAAIPHVRIAGLTSFPCFLYDEVSKKAIATPNAHTVIRSKKILEEIGCTITQVNLPSCNSPDTIPLAAALGATHLEPGHSVTGTNPDNLTAASPLKPAIVYLSEVSHNFAGRARIFGGGHYRRSHMNGVLIRENGRTERAAVQNLNPEAIDYHFELDRTFTVGSPAVAAFRTQIFVTRSRVTAVSGIQSGKPKIEGVYTALGEKIRD